MGSSGHIRGNAGPRERRNPLPSHHARSHNPAIARSRQLFNKVLQLLRPGRVTQLAQRLGLDLADAFARHAELTADFLQRAGAAVIQPKAQLQHLALTWGERLQDVFQLLLEHGKRCRLGRGQGVLILDEIAQMTVFLFTDGRLQGDRLLGNLDDFAHTLHREAHRGGDLLRGRLTTQLLQQGTRDADELVDRLHHVDRDADRPSLVRQRPGDRLPDPPGRIRAELVSLSPVELLDRTDETQIPLLNKVQEEHPAAHVFLGDADDQAQVGLNEATLRFLVALLHALSQVDLLFGGKERDLPDLLEVHPDRVIDRDTLRLGRLFLLLALALLLGLLGVFDDIDPLLQEPGIDAVDELDILLGLRKLLQDVVVRQKPLFFAQLDQGLQLGLDSLVSYRRLRRRLLLGHLPHPPSGRVLPAPTPDSRLPRPEWAQLVSSTPPAAVEPAPDRRPFAPAESARPAPAAAGRPVHDAR